MHVYSYSSHDDIIVNFVTIEESNFSKNAMQAQKLTIYIMMMKSLITLLGSLIAHIAQDRGNGQTDTNIHTCMYKYSNYHACQDF